MNKQEATKLLALIKVAYPTAYRDMDDASKKATVNMWHMSFLDMPYPIMEQAFNRHRMKSKFPPTVAEMVDELKWIYNEAAEGAFYAQSMGNAERLDQFRLVMSYTARYKNGEYAGLNITALAGRIGGGDDGATRNRIDGADCAHFLGAGGMGDG